MFLSLTPSFSSERVSSVSHIIPVTSSKKWAREESCSKRLAAHLISECSSRPSLSPYIPQFAMFSLQLMNILTAALVASPLVSASLPNFCKAPCIKTLQHQVSRLQKEVHKIEQTLSVSQAATEEVC